MIHVWHAWFGGGKVLGFHASPTRNIMLLTVAQAEPTPAVTVRKMRRKNEVAIDVMAPSWTVPGAVEPWRATTMDVGKRMTMMMKNIYGGDDVKASVESRHGWMVRSVVGSEGTVEGCSHHDNAKFRRIRGAARASRHLDNEEDQDPYPLSRAFGSGKRSEASRGLLKGVLPYKGKAFPIQRLLRDEMPLLAHVKATPSNKTTLRTATANKIRSHASDKRAGVAGRHSSPAGRCRAGEYGSAGASTGWPCSKGGRTCTARCSHSTCHAPSEWHG